MAKKTKKGNNSKYFEIVPEATITTKLGELHRQRKKHTDMKRFHNRGIYNTTIEINKLLDKLEANLDENNTRTISRNK